MFAPEVFEIYKQALKEAVEKGWKSAGVEVNYKDLDGARLAVMEANVFRFACAKTDALARQLSTIARKSETFPQFRKAVSELNLVYNKRYLETEYNFAQAVGQNGAKYQRHIKETEVFPYVVYQTIGDDRVRQAHRNLDGKVFQVGSDAYDLIAPPNGWGCRCELNQITKEEYLDGYAGHLVDKEKTVSILKNTPVPGGSNEYEYMVKHGFDKNRGKLGEVFDEKKDFYVKDKKTAVPEIKSVEKIIEPKIPDTFVKNFGKDFAKNPLPAEFWSLVPDGQVYNTKPSVRVRRTKASAYYLPSTREIVMKKTRDFRDSAVVKKMTVVHETGHAVHYAGNYITDKVVHDRLKSRMKDEFFIALQKDIDLAEIPRKFYVRNHWSHVRELRQLDKFKHLSETDIGEYLVNTADTLEAIGAINGRIMGYGHGLTYMLRGNGAYMEIFAHIWENRFLKNPVFEHYFPTLYRESVNLADEIIEDLKRQNEIKKQ